ncbi:unnamed protein product [Adineta steineri]|uniref:PAS domain-containing protein n=1 Tax=Adineta steineri TaxID=433720 RepID=A0A818SK07_9BILA|nr:unnamed protein product [Adineta steineri]
MLSKTRIDLDVTAYAQQRQQNQLPLEEMGNVLLDAMQGTLICLDSHHIIIDVSKTIKRYFGFEQAEIIGLSILLLIEDSERDLFLKFLSCTSQVFDVCCVRMVMAISNEYRQVKVHRKKKLNQDNVDVHSTTTRYGSSVGTILVLTLDDSSYIDITLFDVHKQEFYTKINLIGEIIFEDHRGALITGYLPHELISQSIFNFVYHEDRLVKLHALWKCVTNGTSKLEWRLNARDGSLVFLQTEYKLIANHRKQDTIVARNEILSPMQRSQFEELQTAWRHQCAADIKGNSSSFRLISSADTDILSIPTGECRICVPSLNMCFSTNKLQSLNIMGNIFEVPKSTHPLTIEDYISILIDNDKYLDSELVHLINNLPARSKRWSNNNNNNQSMNNTDISDGSLDERLQTNLNESTLHRKQDSDSIVRGILSNPAKYNHEKQSGDSSATLAGLLNNNNVQQDITRMPTFQQQQQQQQVQMNRSKTNQVPLNSEAIQQQHYDFIKKYKSAKTKLESQLEAARAQELASGGQPSDIIKRNTILNKLSQLEAIKNKHLTRTIELKRQTQQSTSATAIAVNNIEQKDLLNSLFSSSSPKSIGLMSMDSNNSTAISSPISSLYNNSSQSSSPTTPSLYTSSYQHQRNSSPGYRPYESGQSSTSFHDSHTRVKTPVFDEFLTSPPSSVSYVPVNNHSLSVHSYMNVSFQEATNNSSTITPSSFNYHHQHHHNTTYPY